MSKVWCKETRWNCPPSDLLWFMYRRCQFSSISKLLLCGWMEFYISRSLRMPTFPKDTHLCLTSFRHTSLTLYPLISTHSSPSRMTPFTIMPFFEHTSCHENTNFDFDRCVVFQLGPWTQLFLGSSTSEQTWQSAVVDGSAGRNGKRPLTAFECHPSSQVFHTRRAPSHVALKVLRIFFSILLEHHLFSQPKSFDSTKTHSEDFVLLLGLHTSFLWSSSLFILELTSGAAR